MKPRADQKVAVAYPHPDEVSAKFMRSMLHTWRLDAMTQTRPDGSKVGGKLRILDGGALLAVESGAVIARGRNQVVREFLKLDADWLWMIDTDMTWEPDVLERLIEAAHPTLRPIVGGLCFAYMRQETRKFWPTLYAWVPGTERLRRLNKYPLDTLIPVAATGAACLLVHRSVLVEMATRWPPPRPWFDETPFYDTDTDGNAILASGDEYSEDISFCLRAQAAGFPIHVHTGIRCGHVKSFEVDETLFLQEAAILAEAIKPTLPTFAVIASRSRPEMLAMLRHQLIGQVTETFVFDNGYEQAPPDSIWAHGWGLHRMWNAGLDMAEKAANGQPFNVLVINDDVEVPLELCAQLEGGLRVSDEHWISYPNHRELDIAPGEVVRTQNEQMAGQTMSGWCFMLRGETGLRFDERFQWFYADSDLERQVKAAGKFVVAVGGAFVRHLDPLRSTLENPERMAQAWEDEALFAKKWGLDPTTLWLSMNQGRLPALESN